MPAPEDTTGPHPDPRPWRHAGDGWVQCRCGAQHWGTHGAAGLLVTSPVSHTPADRPPQTVRERAVVLQHRALWSHHGGTWGIPGGALAPGESPAAGAVREAVEEAGVPEGSTRAWCAVTLVHPDWAYTTVVGEAVLPFTPAATDAESLEIAWVPVPEVPRRELLPAFGAAWPGLVPLLGRRALVVVDAANTVGSRPDGWWRDRPRAAERLHEALSAALPTGLPAAALGLPAEQWWPDIVLVLEGQARSARVGDDAWPTASGSPSLGVVRAAGSGDDAIVVCVERGAAEGYTDVVVVSADRELARRASSAAGASTVGPRRLLADLANPPR